MRSCSRTARPARSTWSTAETTATSAGWSRATPEPLPRLTARLQVDALLRRAATSGDYATVIAGGDPTAGAILLLARARDGTVTAYTRRADGGWADSFGPERESAATDSYVARQRKYDPDLWVIELETADPAPFIA